MHLSVITATRKNKYNSIKGDIIHMDIIQSMELVTIEVQNADTFLKIPKGDKQSQKIFRKHNNILMRRRVRNICFRIKENRLYDQWEIDREPAVRAIFEGQFRSVDGIQMQWKHFAAQWDVHPTYPLVIITRREWNKEGGKIDKRNGLLVPTAFTSIVQTLPLSMQKQQVYEE